MTMKFRIKPHDLNIEAIGVERWHEMLANYWTHLKKRYGRMPRDLWAYFAGDFFHDGEISKIECSPDMQSVSLDLISSNIRWWKDGNDHNDNNFEFVWSEFHCVFNGVTFFEVAWDEDMEGNPLGRPGRPLQYAYCEIDTLTEKIVKVQQFRDEEAEEDPDEGSPDEFHSLIIRTFNSRTIAMVFKSVTVTPREPLAFEMMQRDPHYHVPLAGAPEE